MTGIEFGQPPPAESAAQLRLETSLRVGEFLDVPFADGPPIRAWVVYPLRNNKAPAVVVVHEHLGLTDWVRAVADQAAAEGYLAVAPDLSAAAAEDRPADSASPSPGQVDELSVEEVQARLSAVKAFVSTLPQANGKVGVMGFGWGGTMAFALAARDSSLAAAVVFYGEAPAPDALSAVKAPVLAHYGQRDAELARMAASTATTMKRLKKSYQLVVYREAFGPFLRVQDGGRDGANEVASVEAWVATFSFFRKYLGK